MSVWTKVVALLTIGSIVRTIFCDGKAANNIIPLGMATVLSLSPPLQPLYAATYVRSGEFLYSDDDTSTPSQTLEEQLKAVQAMQLQSQVRVVKQVKRGTETENLNFEDSQIIVKGLVTLSPRENAADYPLGYVEASILNESFGGKDASLIITAVGQQGPPFAAKRFPLKRLKFPYEFAITTDDLLFPYTPASWLKSPLSKGAGKAGFSLFSPFSLHPSPLSSHLSTPT